MRPTTPGSTSAIRDDGGAIPAEQRDMHPADFAIHIAYAPPHIILGEHLHRQAFALIDPFHAMFGAGSLAHIDEVRSETNETRPRAHGRRRTRRNRRGRALPLHLGGVQCGIRQSRIGRCRRFSRHLRRDRDKARLLGVDRQKRDQDKKGRAHAWRAAPGRMAVSPSLFRSALKHRQGRIACE